VGRAASLTESRMRDNLDLQQQPITDFQRQLVNENAVASIECEVDDAFKQNS